jgi:hypothetical protein
LLSTAVAGAGRIPVVAAYASVFHSGHLGIVLVNKGTTPQVVRVDPGQFATGNAYYVYTLRGDTDNGEFSQRVLVNGTLPTNATGGPIDNLAEIPAGRYSTAGGITVISPGRSAEYLLIEPGAPNSVRSVANTGLPGEFRLRQNYPNPFNPSTVIRYDLPRSAEVTLNVYDLLGRIVQSLVRQRQEAGPHVITFNGTGLPTGVYFCRLEAAGNAATIRMLMVK